MESLKGNTPDAQTFVTVSTKQQRIAELAKRNSQTSFTALAHNIDVWWLYAAYEQVRKDGSPGIDRETAASYSKDLFTNLRSLLDRAKSGLYKAPPVRRVHIPKGTGGKTRPIGLPTFEDKILQRAVTMVLEPIYEQDFSNCSYGFRPGRSAHQALTSLRDRQIATRTSWVLDAWFEKVVKPRMRGATFIVRHADDFIIGFSEEYDARRVMDVLPKRFAKYGLPIHPEKTRLVRFHRPPRNGKPPEGGKPETFDFLGFTHYWKRSQRGYYAVTRKTASSRLERSLRNISDWCRRQRHLSVAEQHAVLTLKMRGHYAYFGITGNGASLAQFWEGVKRTWKKWLVRRSQRAFFNWAEFVRLMKRYPLPRPVVVHSVYRRQ
jgi:hypothetical protein